MSVRAMDIITIIVLSGTTDGTCSFIAGIDLHTLMRHPTLMRHLTPMRRRSAPTLAAAITITIIIIITTAITK